MIIKRWNGSAFVEEFPKTKAQLVFNNGNTEAVFDANDKIKLKFLPDAVFDNLKFADAVSAAASNGSLVDSFVAYIDAMVSNGNLQNAKGFYWVINTGGTISDLGSGVAGTVNTTKYAMWSFEHQDDGSQSGGSGVLEAGDWIVITSISGAGTVGSPYSINFAVVSNVYELATTGADGIVRLSSRTTYAALSGNNVVTEGVLKTVIDNAAFASGTHVHGNISNGGQITATVVTPADTDTILIADASNSGKVERGITIGTGTTTYLRNDGSWGTPAGTYSLPAATSTVRGGIELGSDTQQTVAANAVSSTASRSYALQVNSDGQGVINVPWTDTVYTLPQATTSALGGVKLGTTAATATVNSGTTTAGRFYHVGAQTDGTMYVNVPWTDTTYSAATATTLGLIEIADNTVQSVAANAVSATASRTYGIQLNSNNQAVVNVPWTDTVYTLPAATDTVRGGIELFSATTQATAANAVSSTASRTYGLQVNSDGQGVINVPWTDTTYSAGEGITLSSTTFRMTNPLYVQTATPTTSVTGTIWYDIN